MKKFSYFVPIIITFLTLVVFFLSKNPFSRQYSLQMTLVALIVLGVYRFIESRKSDSFRNGVISQPLAYLLTIFILFLIAATGWFFSPFFFLFYFLALGLAFVFGTVTSSAFVITLALLFSFNIGEIDIGYDFMVILSVLSIIPLGIYLKREYLNLKEASKAIMVIEKEKQKNLDSIETLLSNKVNNFSAVVREPVNDIKQFSYMLQQKTTPEEAREYSSKIDQSLEKIFHMLNQFEADATGKKFVPTDIKK